MNDKSHSLQVEISDVFAIFDQGYILVHLKSFDWDFNEFGAVLLSLPNETVHMRYVAFGNVEGTPVLRLEPRGQENVKEIGELWDKSQGRAYIGRE